VNNDGDVGVDVGCDVGGDVGDDVDVDAVDVDGVS